jgi:hypothetical protein
MIVNNTPLETYELNGVPIIVKREDLCCPFPGPSFSKIRGVVAHIKNRPESVIGVLDTYHSKAGWAVAYVCQQLGKQAVDYWPRFKADNYTGGPAPRFQQQQAAELGATLVDLPAGRSAILYHKAKKHLRENYPDSYLMPNALKLPESITENAAEAVRTAPHLPGSGTLVISISSGTVAAGVLKGFEEAGLLRNYNVILHMGYSRSQDAAREYIEKAAGLTLGDRIKFIDEGYGYADAAPKECPEPWPINPHYDKKALWWLIRNVKDVPGPIVFWSIGD